MYIRSMVYNYGCYLVYMLRCITEKNKSVTYFGNISKYLNYSYAGNRYSIYIVWFYTCFIQRVEMVCLNYRFIYLLIYIFCFIYLSLYLSIYLSIDLHVCIYLSIHLSIFLYAHPSVCLSGSILLLTIAFGCNQV